MRTVPTITVVGVLPTPTESPRQHVANALQMLILTADMHPFLPPLHPELGAARRRVEAALLLLDHGADAFAVTHIDRALTALFDSDVDMEPLPELRAAVARLLRALYGLWLEAGS